MWLFIKGAVMAGGISIVIAALGMVQNLEVLPLMPLLGGLIALPCGALGLIASAKVKNINQFQSVYSFIIAPLYFFSGVFFPVAKAPQWFQLAVHVSPLYHGVRLCQMAFWYNGTFAQIAYHLGMLIMFTVVLTLIANRMIRRLLIH
jgi:lipooligosaccharide transport system permease protein